MHQRTVYVMQNGMLAALNDKSGVPRSQSPATSMLLRPTSTMPWCMGLPLKFSWFLTMSLASCSCSSAAFTKSREADSAAPDPQPAARTHCWPCTSLSGRFGHGAPCTSHSCCRVGHLIGGWQFQVPEGHALQSALQKLSCVCSWEDMAAVGCREVTEAPRPFLRGCHRSPGKLSP